MYYRRAKFARSLAPNSLRLERERKSFAIKLKAFRIVIREKWRKLNSSLEPREHLSLRWRFIRTKGSNYLPSPHRLKLISSLTWNEARCESKFKFITLASKCRQPHLYFQNLPLPFSSIYIPFNPFEQTPAILYTIPYRHLDWHARAYYWYGIPMTDNGHWYLYAHRHRYYIRMEVICHW